MIDNERPTAGSSEESGSGRPRRWTRRQILVLSLLLLATIFNYVDRQILPLLQELVKADMALSDSQLGLITGPAFAIFYAISGLPIARLAERFNRVTLMGGVVALWSGMTALCGAAMNVPMLMAARFGVGLGEGGCVPVSHSLMSDTFSARQRGFAMSILSTAQPIAGVMTPLAAGYIAYNYGWRAAFIVIGSLGLVLAATIVLSLRDPRAKSTPNAVPRPLPESFRKDFVWLFRNRAYVWLFVAGAFMGIGNVGIGTFLASVVIRAHSLTLAEASSFLALNGLMGLIGTFIGGYLADRFAGDRGQSYPLVCSAGALLAGIIYLIAFVQGNWIAAASFLLAAGIATDLKNGPNFAAIQNLAPSRMRATAAAVYMLAATLIGSGVGPPLAGVLSDYFANVAYGGGFAEQCTATGLSAQLEKCKAASAEGLVSALKSVAFAYFASATAFYMCSRSYRVIDDGPTAGPAAAE